MTNRAAELEVLVNGLQDRITELEADLDRVYRLPELEWATVTANLCQYAALLSRDGHHEAANQFIQTLDKGKVYVSRIIRENEELKEDLGSGQRIDI